MASESEQRDGDLVASEVVGGDEQFDGNHDVVMIFRLGSDDGQEAGAVVDSNDGLCIAMMACVLVCQLH